MALYTQEQLEKANNIDLEDFLARRGAKLRRTGKESRFYYSDSGGEHDSVSISGNRWYDHKNQTGGYPIKFMQEFYGLGFWTEKPPVKTKPPLCMKIINHGKTKQAGRRSLCRKKPET